MKIRRHVWTLLTTSCMALAICTISTSWAGDDEFKIEKAEWKNEKDKIVVIGKGQNGNSVTLKNADTLSSIGSTSVNDGKWRVVVKAPSSVPCSIRAEQSDGKLSEKKDVDHAPSNCDDGEEDDGDSDDDDGGGGSALKPKNEFNIMMNYELGMHCTGFEFSYCCVLPPYNSILAQVVKTEKNEKQKHPELLEADPNVGLDALGRPTVVRDKELDSNNNFKKYVLRYWHEAQPRNDGLGAPQSNTLISLVEGNSLLMWNTVFDAAVKNSDGSLKTGSYNGADGVLQGNGNVSDNNDNYANAWMNHLYFYEDLEGNNSSGTSLDADKIRLGMDVIYPENTGAALQPLGPNTNGGSPGPFDNVLTFSGEKGTVVFTQMKVLENLPVMLTSPRIWESLGLPLTPFEDSIDFFGDPGLVDESSVRPYVVMKAQLHHYDPTKTGGIGDAVLDDGNPVIGFGNAPIDIPNCERCHALGDGTSVNSAQNGYPEIAAMVQGEMDFWNAYYSIGGADSDWYSRIKGAAISMLALHDEQHGTSFTANFPATGAGMPQNTRLGHETVLCQRCHADNVIAVVKSATSGGNLIPPLSEAIHLNHKDNPFDDSLGRNGGCQGCHPAHRSDGDMLSYPIDELGLNAFAGSDNRDAAGGCYVGRDAHANPDRNSECTTPSHLNAAGKWLVNNVSNDTGTDKGIWCTNCHNQFGQELWKAENVESLVHAKPGDPGHVREPSANATLAQVAAGIGLSEAQAIDWLDPKTNDDVAAIWNSDPGLCDHVSGLFGGPSSRFQDGNVATIEVNLNDQFSCSTGEALPGPDCDGETNPDFYICGTTDPDGDFSVNILDFCTTDDCVNDAGAGLPSGSLAVPVPFSAATDGRDHWLAAGEPHCADCHAAPYVEQSGNINAFPPFNYPRKASLFRYSRGHQDITCQGCHESIHGLYPVTKPGLIPGSTKAVDQTSWDQAASMNSDGSHGPLKCGACHLTNDKGVLEWAEDLEFNGQKIKDNYDLAVGFAHTYTAEADNLSSVCLNCHEDESDEISANEEEWLVHADKGRISRGIMDKVEVLVNGHVSGDPDVVNPLNTVCIGCHDNKNDEVSCDQKEWKRHLTEGRVSQKVWEHVSNNMTGWTCGW